MWIEYDEDVDVLYIRLDETKREFTNEVHDGVTTVVFDVDAIERIAAIEILDASRHVNLAALQNVLRRPSRASA